MQQFIRINELDNVAVALTTLEKDFSLSFEQEGQPVQTLEEIPAGHKVALRDIREGEDVIKYGYRIGIATSDIPAGSWVHTHNIRTGLGDLLEYKYEPVSVKKQKGITGTFRGFLRDDGNVGVRNEIWIIPTVGCVGKVAEAIAAVSKKYLKGSVSDVIAFNHPYGCSQMGDDQENTRNILCDLIKHPNAGGVLVLSLGCENSNLDVLRPMLGEVDENRVKFLVCQESEDEIEDGAQIVKKLIEYAGADERQDVPVSKLVIGLKCGGSDGLSGITANPLVGRFSDRLVSKGGTTILTRTELSPLL